MAKIWSHSVQQWRKHIFFGALLVWSISMIAFAYIIDSPYFADPDSFYHIKIAELIAHTKAPVIDFPWLAFTSLTQSYVDHHFLYHVFLIPWMLLFGNVIGAKVATVVLAASTIALFYSILRSLRIPGATFFALLLLSNPDFSFRMGLTKATTVGFLFMLTGLYFMLKRNYRLLSILAFGFVWSYGGFLLLTILAGVVVVARTILHLAATRALPTRREALSLALPLISVVSGTVAGLAIHPSFPEHLHFYWEQIIQIGFINYSNIIGVGGEWYPYDPSQLAFSMIVATALYGVALVCMYWNIRKLTERSWVTLIMSFFFIAFTLKSRRYVEYGVPWAILASACIFTDAHIVQRLWIFFRTQFQHWSRIDIFSKILLSVSAIMVSITTIVTCVDSIHAVHRDMQSGFETTLFTRAGEWLQKHATEGDIVFHDDWSTFPILFYHSTKTRYIVGLDTTFMYRYSEDLYWKWANITLNKYDEDIYPVIANDFHARFVFVDHNHTVLRNRLLADHRFVQVYQDEEATIFRIPRQ